MITIIFFFNFGRLVMLCCNVSIWGGGICSLLIFKIIYSGYKLRCSQNRATQNCRNKRLATLNNYLENIVFVIFFLLKQPILCQLIPTVRSRWLKKIIYAIINVTTIYATSSLKFLK